uniref:Uncharacterized protein n=1 Tax=Arundo donax TaxID=35708 RepID=A0A0A9BWQ7_ARUDO
MAENKRWSLKGSSRVVQGSRQIWLFRDVTFWGFRNGSETNELCHCPPGSRSARHKRSV